MCANVHTFKLREFKVRSRQSFASGAFGEVWDAWHEKYKRVAVKVLRHNVDHCRFMEELEVMGKASQEFCCVPTFGGISETLGPYQVRGIVTEFMPCGTLNDLVCNRVPIPLPRCLACRLLYDVSNAMHKLHALNVDQRLLHCDLKETNILLDDNLHAKITDFGASRFATVTQERRREGPDPNQVGTDGYMPPEYDYHVARTSKSDVYSFGVVMTNVINGIRDNEEKADLEELAQRAKSDDPDQRPHFSEIQSILHNLVSDRTIDEEVLNIKASLKRKRGIQTFLTQPHDYPFNLIEVWLNNTEVRNQTSDQPTPHEEINSRLENNDALPMHPVGDNTPSTTSLLNELLSDEDCVTLGKNLHYTSGWQMLAYKLGLKKSDIENISEENRKAVNCKISIFQQWKHVNSPASKAKLIAQLKDACVAMDVWEFLDPDCEIRNEL